MVTSSSLEEQEAEDGVGQLGELMGLLAVVAIVHENVSCLCPQEHVTGLDRSYTVHLHTGHHEPLGGGREGEKKCGRKGGRGRRSVGGREGGGEGRYLDYHCTHTHTHTHRRSCVPLREIHNGELQGRNDKLNY